VVEAQTYDREDHLAQLVFVPERHGKFQSEFRHGCDAAVPRRRPIMFYKHLDSLGGNPTPTQAHGEPAQSKSQRLEPSALYR